MAYDPDEMIPFKGRMVTKDVIFHKVKGLGWNTRLFSQLTDEEMIMAMEQRKTPQQMGKTMEAVFEPKPVVDLNSEAGSDPSIMGPPGTQSREEPVPAGVVPVGDSGVAVAAVAPPAHAGKHLRPIDPTRPQTAQSQASTPQPRPPFVPPPHEITVRPPKTDTAKLMSMIDAAFQLASIEAMAGTAKTLIQTNGLERAFQALYPELAKKVLGRIDTTPDAKCRGGTILDIEMEAESGYCHIITSAGTITITGMNLIHKGADK